MSSAPWLWLWLEVIRPSWLSIALAPVVLTGYRLLGRRRRAGWWFVIASNAGLLAIGLSGRQYGLVVVVVLIWQAFQNWWRWGPGVGSNGRSGAVVRGALWANDLTRLCPPQPSCGEYVLVEVRPALASRLAAAMAVDEREVAGRLERGCRAFAARDCRGEVVSWLWVSTGREWAPPLRRTLRFPDGDCYGWDAGTLEGHRGRGLFTALLECAGWHMAQEGCHTMWGGILDGNLASQRANACAGTRPILRVVAHHEPPPTRLQAWPADYADERLVERARRMLGDLELETVPR